MQGANVEAAPGSRWQPAKGLPEDLWPAISAVGDDQWTARRDLPRGPRSAGVARGFACQALLDWNLQALTGDVEAIVSELAANAASHGTRGSAAGTVELILWRRAGHLLCMVTDPGAGAPVLAPPDPGGENGRGLQVVQALSSRWGWTTLGPERKAVWAAVRFTAEDSAASDRTDLVRAPPESARPPAGHPRGAAALAGLGLGQPHPARITDCLLGGTANFQADRDAAASILAQVPAAAAAALEQQRFAERAAAWLIGQGIRQIIDMSEGLPAGISVRALAGPRPFMRITCAYVASDPVVLAHCRARAAGNPDTTAVRGSFRQGASALADPQLRRLINLENPVAVLLPGVLQYIPDADAPAALIRALLHALPAGSYLAVSHLTSGGSGGENLEAARDVYARAGAPLTFRSRAQIAALLEGCELADPGLVHPWQWRPAEAGPPGTAAAYAGVGRLP